MQGHRREEQQAFIAFRSHYLFESRFCAPGKGRDAERRGLVENLVGYARRNFFTPVPRVDSWEAFNAELLACCIAERERQAHIILGESEKQIAASFAEASKAYSDNPTALHLRAMNMLFEGLREKGALVIVPSSAVETMNLGGIAAMTALASGAGTAPSETSQGKS